MQKQKTSAKWALAASLFGGLVAGVQSLDFATGKYGDAMFVSYFTHPLILLFNLLPPLLLAALFWLLCRRAAWSYLCTSLIVLIPSLVHYYKLNFRGDPLLAEDISLIGESGKMLETYHLFMDRRIWMHLCLFLFLLFVFAVFVRGGGPKKKTRRIALPVLLAALIGLLPLYTADGLYKGALTANADRINPWSDTESYISKGFVYPFLHSVKDAMHLPPVHYSEKEAENILAGYTDEPIPADKAVNIVCVMLEAFNDFSRFEELEFTKDIYGKYHELESMGVSGRLYVDVFAGDTRISEREFLTGLPYTCMDNFVDETNSYVWYLKQCGYTVEGAHPCYGWFYNREHINKNLGFENYYFTENFFRKHTGQDITYDLRYFDILKYFYTYRDRTKPYFSFNISYQGHGPYESDHAYYEPVVRNKGYSDEAYTVLGNYLGSQASTVDVLYDYATEMLQTDEPLVLVFFGDHKPWLGNEESVYRELGIDLDTSTEEGFDNYYTTRYLILANDAAKALCQNDFCGAGEDLSVKFLLNKVFALCGYTGSAYMQFTSDVMADCPTLHRTSDLSEGTAALYDRVSYYYRRNWRYGD